MNSFRNVTDTPLPRLAERPPESHKGDFGRALLIGGSIGMSGAIALAGKATLRSGAGLVTLAVPRCVQPIVAAIEPSYMTHALADAEGCIAESAAEDICTLAGRFTALALGPGLGRSAAISRFVVRLYTTITQPMVVDADALFSLAEHRDILHQPGGPRVLTPHPGEFLRLIGKSHEKALHVATDDEQRAQLAAELARDGVVVVLKGHRTVVTDGSRLSINHTGNPGMATGGSGDVLTGVITGLICQGLPPWEAARLGAHVHGLAGDLAVADFGQLSMIASDLIEYLPVAFQSLNVGC